MSWTILSPLINGSKCVLVKLWLNFCHNIFWKGYYSSHPQPNKGIFLPSSPWKPDGDAGHEIHENVGILLSLLAHRQCLAVCCGNHESPAPGPRASAVRSCVLGPHLSVVFRVLVYPKTSVLWSDQISRPVVSDSLRPHESQHARPPCPSPTPGVHSDSGPLSQWCHPAISSSVIPFSSCPQSLPASESFPMSQLFARGGQSTGVSALASFLPKKSQGWSPSEWTGWISLQSKGLSRVFSNTTVQKHQFFSAQPSSQSNSHIQTWPQEKP